MPDLLLSVNPLAVRDRLDAALADQVDNPIGFGPAGFALELYWPTGRRRRMTGSVLVSQAPFDEGEWLHASIDRIKAIPRYDDLVALHKAVFGERFAYQVFAPSYRHVSIAEHCLHLWGRVDDRDGRILPDFGAAGSI
jgi:hypothetical protein